jgi:hypothetical protein
VAQRADRDHRVGGVDRYAAAVRVLEPDHVVDVRIAGQQLVADAAHRDVEHAGYALHGRRDRQDIARADRPVGVAVALEREALDWRRGGRTMRGHRQAPQLARGRHFDQSLVHPAARGDRFERVADRHAVAHDGRAGGQVDERNLVRLRHLVEQPDATRQQGAGRQAAVVADDRDVVAVAHADQDRLHGRDGAAQAAPCTFT